MKTRIFITFFILFYFVSNSQNTNLWLLNKTISSIDDCFSLENVQLWVDAQYSKTTEGYYRSTITNKTNINQKFNYEEYIYSFQSDGFIRFSGNQFSNTSSLADSTFLFGDDDFTIFLVFRNDKKPNNEDEVVYKNYNTRTPENRYFYIMTDGSIQIMTDRNMSEDDNKIQPNFNLRKKESCLLTYERSAGSLLFYKNGDLAYTYNGDLANINFPKTDNNGIFLGAHSSYCLAELIVIREHLSDVRRKYVEDFLKKKWNLK